MSKNENKDNHNHNGCCGGHEPQCACHAYEGGLITAEEANILRMVNVIMQQGQKTEKKNSKLYQEMLADADLTNIGD